MRKYDFVVLVITEKHGECLLCVLGKRTPESAQSAFEEINREDSSYRKEYPKEEFQLAALAGNGSYHWWNDCTD